MQTPSDPTTSRRIGFHYFPDTAHYRQIDLEAWLPELQRLGAASVTLIAPPTRAIPENFISGLLAGGIEPILHFPFHCRSSAKPSKQDAEEVIVPGCIPAPDALPPLDTLRLLLNSYARWGVRQVVFFERPNLRPMWTPSDWLQGDLVECFLDIFLPTANLALEAGLSPIFPPLAPGGDYWDLSFLRSALRGLKRRRAAAVLDKLGLAVEAFAGEQPLDWGAGGPERWPAARPYFTPDGQQDHLGFRIFEWYLSVSGQELGSTLPLILLRTGQRRTGVIASASTASAGLDLPAGGPASAAGGEALPGEAAAPAGPQFAADIAHARQNLAIAELLAADPKDGGLPAEIQAGHFWLLSAAPRTPAASESWFPPAGRLLAVVSAFQAWASHLPNLERPEIPTPANEEVEKDAPPDAEPPQNVAPALGPSQEDPASATTEESKPEAGGFAAAAAVETFFENQSRADRVEAIDHYILLPLYAWGAADWDLALIQPLVQDGHPTIGFSLTEARLARRVTVVGGQGAVSVEALAMLQKAGCQVERLIEDGTIIAS